MANILLGVSGSIAAYKAADITSRLVRDGHSVDVVMTKNAQEFIAPLTFETLTKKKVYTDSFAHIEDYSVEHISLAKRASIVIVAPATANLIGKLAAGIADDLLTTVLMAAHKTRTIICPAMNTEMLFNPVVQGNIEKLRELGYEFVEPGDGKLACGDCGKGKLATVDEILVTVNGK